MLGLGDVSALFSLIDRYKIWKNSNSRRVTIEERFVQLFEGHRVKRAQIPRFFKNDLTFYDCEDDNALRAKLDIEKISEASEIFGVKKEWLEGATDTLYTPLYFYKKPASFGDYLDHLEDTCGVGEICSWVLICSVNRQSVFHFGREVGELKSVIILGIKIGDLGDESILKYIIIDVGGNFSYWKCRADLASCVAQLWKRSILPRGLIVEGELLERISSGNKLINCEFHNTIIKGTPWDVKGLFSDPSTFLNGISEGEFGQKAALSRWLEWESKGLMNADMGSFRRKFENALKELN